MLIVVGDRGESCKVPGIFWFFILASSVPLAGGQSWDDRLQVQVSESIFKSRDTEAVKRHSSGSGWSKILVTLAKTASFGSFFNFSHLSQNFP